MTLDNLRYALYLNNLKLLEKIAYLGGTDITSLAGAFNAHKEDLVIHVSQADKDFWNSILDNAKEYAKQLFDGVTHMTIEIVDALPEEPKLMTIYLVPVSQEGSTEQVGNYYNEYMFVNDKWEIIGNTHIDLTPYLQREQFEKIIANYVTTKDLSAILADYIKVDSFHKHDNIDVLSQLSVSDKGILLFNQQAIESGTSITDEEIQQAITDTLAILKANKQ